jgi:hypothetical protein
LNKFNEILKKYLNESEKHLKRLNRAHSKMKPFMPLNANNIQKLTEDEIEHIDQYLYRFAKLQGCNWRKAFYICSFFSG